MTRKWGARALTLSLALGLLGAAGAGVAAPAQAAGVPVLGPAGASAIHTIPIDVTASNAMAAAAYGLSVGNLEPAAPLKVVVTNLSGQPAGSLRIQRTAAGATPAAAGTWTTTPLATTAEGALGTVITPAPTGTERYFLATKVPGSYGVTFYQEGSTGDQTRFTQDADGFTSVQSTVLSYDLNHSTPSAADDEAAGISFLTSPLAVGQSSTVLVALPEVDATDVRGAGTDGKPVLGAALRGTNGLDGPLRIQFALGGQPVQTGALAFNGVQGGPRPAAITDVYTTTYGPAPVAGRITATLRAGAIASTTSTEDIGRVVTLSAPATAQGEEKIRVTGTADPGAAVDVYARREGSATPTTFVFAKTLTAAADGSWSLGTTMRQTTQFQARVNGKTSIIDSPDTSTTEVHAWLDVSAKALGGGKVQWTVNGRPNVTGYIDVWLGSAHLAHTRSDAAGDKVFTTTSATGRRTFQINFSAPGCVLGEHTLTGTVK